MIATVPHVTSGLGLRKFQVDGFLLTRVYIGPNIVKVPADSIFRGEAGSFKLLVPFCSTLWHHIWIGCNEFCSKGPRSSPLSYP